MGDRDYSVAPDPGASGPCLGCGLSVLPDSGFTLRHASGRRSSPYCSRACVAQDMAADILAEDFDEGDVDLNPIDEPR